MNTPFVMIIFGATGDLARSKLVPALYSLYTQKQLSEKFFIVGFARRPFTDAAFRKMLAENLRYNDTYHYSDSKWKAFSKNIFYQQGFFDKSAGYEQLINTLNQFDKEMGACITRFFYLATPPDHYVTILNLLNTTKLAEGCGQGSNKWTRLIIEKPFGKDLATARALDKRLSEIFAEKQIFRVDHYLGKETVQNIVTFRFANGIFEPVWNKNYIDHVQITWAEKKGVEDRGNFFDGIGLLRDVAQNHLMQLTASVAMESPKSFSKEGIRDARASAIGSIRCIEPDEVSQLVVRGQYGWYRNEKDVRKNSNTETFVAMKLHIDTERFSGVPFYIRAGKKMPNDTVTISIVFIQTCHILFKEFGCPEEGNVLTIRIQPDEGIGIRVIAKKPFDKAQEKPGLRLDLGTVDMKFSYKEEFGGKGVDAYEKLLLDIFGGDQMLFNRSDELESSWEFITRILEGWQKQRGEIPVYKPDTWGPLAANQLIERDGRKWLYSMVLRSSGVSYR